MRVAVKKLSKKILDVSDRLRKFSGYKGSEFIIHCRQSMKEVLGDNFKIGDYSYVIVVDDELLERENKDGSFEADLWITEAGAIESRKTGVVI